MIFITQGQEKKNNKCEKSHMDWPVGEQGQGC